MGWIESKFITPRGYAIAGFISTLIGVLIASDTRQWLGEAIAGLGLCLVGATLFLGAALMRRSD